MTATTQTRYLTNKAAEYKRAAIKALDERDAARKQVAALTKAAAALLGRLDKMTSYDFSMGGERKEREALRSVLESK